MHQLMKDITYMKKIFFLVLIAFSSAHLRCMETTTEHNFEIMKQAARLYAVGEMYFKHAYHPNAKIYFELCEASPGFSHLDHEQQMELYEKLSIATKTINADQNLSPYCDKLVQSNIADAWLKTRLEFVKTYTKNQKLIVDNREYLKNYKRYRRYLNDLAKQTIDKNIQARMHLNLGNYYILLMQDISNDMHRENTATINQKKDKKLRKAREHLEAAAAQDLNIPVKEKAQEALLDLMKNSESASLKS